MTPPPQKLQLPEEIEPPTPTYSPNSTLPEKIAVPLVEQVRSWTSESEEDERAKARG